MASPPNHLCPNVLPVLPGAAAQQAQPQARGQAANWQGGYDCDFVQPPPEAVQSECPICHLVLREPYQAPCCGNSFCRTCIEPIRLGDANCPTCRHAGFTTFPDKRLERSLNPLKVFCSRRDEDCEWNGELGSLGRHLNENPTPSERLVGCNFVDVNCTHCAQSFRRKSLDTHENECRLRPYSCDHCGEFASSFEEVVVSHYPVCERYPLPCPNKCDEISEGFKYAIERRDLERHVKEECLLTVVECDFHYAGCEARLPRKDMASHLAESIVTHMSLMAVHGRKTATEAKKTAIEAQRALEERDAQIALLQREQSEQHVVVDELKKQLELHSHLCTPPVTFTMTDFTQHKRNKDTWYSSPFYTHPHGYMMRILVIYKEVFLFIGALLMRGKFDDQLLWPFKKTIYIRILNQCSEKCDIISPAQFSSYHSEGVNKRVTTGEQHMKGFGESLPYITLDSRGDCTKAYVKDDTIQLQVTEVVDSLLASRLEGQILSTFDQISLNMPPHQIVMTDFEQYKERGHCWYSPTFYTHREGYRMCLQVYANGKDVGNGTHDHVHVSVFTSLMRGEFDSRLKWPFRGTVTIQLVNQLEDKEHFTEPNSYTGKTPNNCAARVTNGERSGGWGTSKFILHSELGLSVANNRQYLKDDRLVFRIVSVKIK